MHKTYLFTHQCMLKTNFRLGPIVLCKKFNQVNVKILLNHFDTMIIRTSKVSKCQHRCLIEWKKLILFEFSPIESLLPSTNQHLLIPSNSSYTRETMIYRENALLHLE